MSNSIKLSVINPKRPLASQIFTYSFCFVITLWFLALILLNDPNNLITKLLVPILAIFIVWMLLIRKPYTTIGHLTLNNKSIRFSSKGDIQVYPIEEINNLTFKYLGYYGRVDILGSSFDSGLGNKLSFSFLEKHLCFEIFINKTDIALLKRIFYQWKLKNKHVHIKNFLGQKVNL